MPLRRTLTLLTLAGFVVPNAMLAVYMVRHGFAPADYFGDWVERLPAAQLTVDLGLCCAAFLAWAGMDAARSGVRNWWWSIVGTFTVGLCFGIPLYLLMRERAVSRASLVPA